MKNIDDYLDDIEDVLSPKNARYNLSECERPKIWQILLKLRQDAIAFGLALFDKENMGPLNEEKDKRVEVSDLTKEKLVEFLDTWTFPINNKETLRAYTQLRKIVEEHFSEPPKTVDEAMQKAHEEGVRQVFGKADTEPVQVDEEEEQPPMDKETAGDMKYHALKDEGLLDEFGRRKQ